MITVKEADRIIRSRITVMNSEKVMLENCSGRILAQEIVASFPQPRFDNTAMDGFAVRAVDTVGASADSPVTFSMKGVIPAGEPTDIVIGQEECCQIMTGAPIPEGADSVVMVEDSGGFENDRSVDIFKEVKDGENIRYCGEEIAEGEILINPGNHLNAGEIGVAATFGYGNIEVYRQPKISLFATGDELIEPGNELKPGQIYNSNFHVFSELSDRVGAQVIIRIVLKDDSNSLKKNLSEALITSNVIVSSGGVSMGKHDYVRDVFLELGVEEHFWKVAQKPGKPLFFGTGNNTLIFGLPGNPVSSYIGFMEWVWPVLENMMGIPDSKPKTGILAEPFPREKLKHRYLFGQAWLEDGKLVCKPATKIGSHMLSSSLEANCILGSGSGEIPLQAGDEIHVNILPWKNLQ